MTNQNRVELFTHKKKISTANNSKIIENSEVNMKKPISRQRNISQLQPARTQQTSPYLKKAVQDLQKSISFITTKRFIDSSRGK